MRPPYLVFNLLNYSYYKIRRQHGGTDEIFVIFINKSYNKSYNNLIYNKSWNGGEEAV